ncbi:endo alpha-1,4 polygalactosaminidase [Planosporangium sp. 12N6]|uniref:endo alpha-1,4 polygalactosaminidase n=1 Tax=Planosporangium spinosum TaxID=3402278 RepID=UPI003CE82747
MAPLAALVTLTACTPLRIVPAPPSPSASPSGPPALAGWVYQLQNYPDGKLDALARAPQRLAVIDLARDGGGDYFTAAEVAALRASGKKVLAYFQIGAIEDSRPEYALLRQDANDLVLNRPAGSPDEYFVRYWDERWWKRVIAPRVDQAIRAGFDGVYVDTPVAFEAVDLSTVREQTRGGLGRAMVELVRRISGYAKRQRPGFWVVPQNSPELQSYPDYTAAIDGIGVQELFFLDTDRPCSQGWCGGNLEDARNLRDAGKVVLAVDYATRADNVKAACDRYRRERFAGYVTVRELDRVSAACP